MKGLQEKKKYRIGERWASPRKEIGGRRRAKKKKCARGRKKGERKIGKSKKRERRRLGERKQKQVSPAPNFRSGAGKAIVAREKKRFLGKKSRNAGRGKKQALAAKGGGGVGRVKRPLRVDDEKGKRRTAEKEVMGEEASKSLREYAPQGGNRKLSSLDRARRGVLGKGKGLTHSH